MFPSIPANGSGLLRAVANSIWGLQDEAIDFFLRRLLHVALTSGKQQPTFKERWQLEQEQANFNSDAQSHSKVLKQGLNVFSGEWRQSRNRSRPTSSFRQCV